MKHNIYLTNYTNSIGILVADSPVGPWTDPIGRPLIS